ncbi:MAG TPA: ABC transporter permease subunit [Roseiflexaceae bacterium]|nr:ABC transporter permease subunit [Roseiflexaceae bacterium]
MQQTRGVLQQTPVPAGRTAPADRSPQRSTTLAGRRLWQFLPWIVPLGLLVLWQALSSLGLLNPRVLPAPVAVVTAAIELSGQGRLLPDIWISFQRAISGFLVGGSIGFALGLLNGYLPLSERLLDSTLQMLRTIPSLSLIPLVILWFGIGDEARLFLVSAGVLFPIYINTLHGVRSVDPQLIEMGRVYGLSTRALFWEIILPGALPSILVGVRYALGIMWLTLIVAETIAADSGIGHITMEAREFMRTNVVVMGILIYALLGKLADSTARLAERRLLRWHPNYQQV